MGIKLAINLLYYKGIFCLGQASKGIG